MAALRTIFSRVPQHLKTKQCQIETTTRRCLSDKVKFAFIEAKSGQRVPVEAEEGKTVLDVALAYDVDIEGACGGELACSTCHVVVSDDLFKKLPPKLEEEDDMLDLAWGLTKTYVFLSFLLKEITSPYLHVTD
jgi:ferredoxin